MPFELLEAARDLIAVDTVSANGNRRLVPLLETLAGAAGLKLSVLETPGEPAQVNLLFHGPGGRPPDGSANALLLLTHTDTVSPGPLDRWTVTDPLTPKVEGDRLYGLGSADVKVDLLCKLLALERTARLTRLRPVAVLGTHGEEVGLRGARQFAAAGPFRAAYVVCGEPSDLAIIHAHKGYLVARVRLGQRRTTTAHRVREVVFTGRSAHSSTPELGENAIQRALAAELTGVVAIRGGQGANSVPAQCVVEVADGQPDGLPLGQARTLVLRFGELVANLSPRQDPRFTPATAVSNLGVIAGKDGVLELVLDCRLLPGHSPRDLAHAFEEEVLELGGEVGFERENPAVYTRPDGPLCQAALETSAELGLAGGLQTKATNTEAAAFAGTAEAIVFGPGTSVGNAHCPNEHASIRQLFQAIDWYEGLIRRLCAPA